MKKVLYVLGILLLVVLFVYSAQQPIEIFGMGWGLILGMICFIAKASLIAAPLFIIYVIYLLIFDKT